MQNVIWLKFRHFVGRFQLCACYYTFFELCSDSQPFKVVIITYSIAAIYLCLDCTVLHLQIYFSMVAKLLHAQLLILTPFSLILYLHLPPPLNQSLLSPLFLQTPSPYPYPPFSLCLQCSLFPRLPNPLSPTPYLLSSPLPSGTITLFHLHISPQGP